jgi:hypothetical protein
VKTLFDTKFRCPRTIAEVPIVNPGASYEVEFLGDTSFLEFSHSLDPKLPAALPESCRLLVAGWGFHTLESAALARRTPQANTQRLPAQFPAL